MRIFRRSPPKRKSPSEQLVQRMMDHKLVRIPCLRFLSGLERRLYASIVTCVYDSIWEPVRDFETTILDHRLHVDVRPPKIDRRLDPVLVDTDPVFFRKLVDVYMDQNPRLHMRFLPRGFERRVYANLLGLMLGMLDVILQSVRVMFLGHAFSIQVRTLTPEEWKACLDRAHSAPTCPVQASDTLQRIVDQHVRQNPIRWIPKRVHKGVLYHAFRVIRALSAEILESSQVDAMDHRIRAWFRPTTLGSDASNVNMTTENDGSR